MVDVHKHAQTIELGGDISASPMCGVIIVTHGTLPIFGATDYVVNGIRTTCIPQRVNLELTRVIDDVILPQAITRADTRYNIKLTKQ